MLNIVKTRKNKYFFLLFIKPLHIFAVVRCKKIYFETLPIDLATIHLLYISISTE